MMPRARLGAGSWQFENDALARLRDKIVTGKKTLARSTERRFMALQPG